jgi:hypothetical protein
LHLPNNYIWIPNNYVIFLFQKTRNALFLFVSCCTKKIVLASL